MIFNRHYLFIQYRRVGLAHRFRGVYTFVLVGGAHPTKHMPEPGDLRHWLPALLQKRIEMYNGAHGARSLRPVIVFLATRTFAT